MTSIGRSIDPIDYHQRVHGGNDAARVGIFGEDEIVVEIARHQAAVFKVLDEHAARTLLTREGLDRFMSDSDELINYRNSR